jgi:membrane protein
MGSPFRHSFVPAWVGRLRGGRLETLARVLVTTGRVFVQTKATTRAAALSYNSLFCLGPLVAILAIAAGLVLGQGNSSPTAKMLDQALQFIAPQLREYKNPAQPLGASQKASPAVATAANLINRFVHRARRGYGGTIGIIVLIAIAMMLFSSIEQALNEIWDVRSNRSWAARLLRYAVALVFGVLLFVTAATLPGAGAFAAAFKNRLPFGREVGLSLQWLLPLVGYGLVAGLLTLFYRLAPYARVTWRAAFIGGLVVAAALVLNNVCAFLYLHRVVQTQDLYGSLALVPVLMFGLYIFWLCLLIGGHLSFAVQNARTLEGTSGGKR